MLHAHARSHAATRAAVLGTRARALQEEMYSFVTVAEDQSTKGKGVTVVQDA